MYTGDMFTSSITFFIIAGFIIVFGVILWQITSTIKQNVNNNAAPVLSVSARVIAKRTEVKGDHSYTSYYATFEVESGDRMEFKITGKEFGLLAEGDVGILTFQGTRLKSFERNRS
ncbi:DUF2500 domain-containing protein [Ureibacillus sp. 179-F W5.1 NHS]|uniref:DUF2500 domain-containing protein n=1 Tax=Lysinibacillus halotolerans TaxID=1368476 RepID=A0A3M8H1R2_9BACI|nr:DUF2500 domain-containing protein [Lysinibacillus halotolerans]